MRSKLFVPLSLLCWQLSASAQVRVFAGPLLTTANYKIGDARQVVDPKTGFVAGVALTTLVEGPIYFSPSFSFKRKGFKVSFDRPSTPPDGKAKSNDLTVNAFALAPLLQVNFSKNESRLFVRFGPALEIAASGKENFVKTTNETVKRPAPFGPTAYSRTTTWADLQLGFQHGGRLGFFAFYEQGLSSLNNADLGPVVMQRVVGVAVEWRTK